MRLSVIALLAGLAAALPGASSLAGTLPAGLGGGDTAKGPVLTDPRGHSLYVFDKDRDGVPACYDACAQIWPAAVAPAGFGGDGDVGVVARKDGQRQLTYKGKPLYSFQKDAAPGDVGGEGFRDVWHLARP